MKIDWVDLKLLDISTNHPSRTAMCRHLLNMGYDIKYYCGYKNYPKRFDELPNGVIRYLHTPSIPKKGMFLILRIVPLIVQKLFIDKPDILILNYLVYIFAAPFLFVGRWFNKKTKIILDIRTLPVIIKSFHRDIKLFRLSLKIAKKTCDGFTFITPAMRDYCREIIDLDDKEVSIWSSGVAEDIFNPKNYVKQVKKSFELFYHGSLSLDRGIGNLMEAQKILRDKGYPISLTLIGALEDEREFKHIIARNNLENVCFILNPVPHEDIPQMIMDCDLPVIPFPHFIGWEVSSPIKLMEYMAMAKAIVLTDIRAHKDVVGKNPFGFFPKSEKPIDLADAIERAYLSRDQFSDLGKLARETALQKYTWKSQAENLAGFFEGLS